jgi:nucleoside-diphosphate-sugar epimerase
MRIFLTGASGFIGTHLVTRLCEVYPSAEILNVDLAAPKLATHRHYWLKADIMDYDSLLSVVATFRPTHVIHMAARTDPDGTRVEDYAVNTQGSANLIKVIKEIGCVQHSIFFSTQYVVCPGPLPVRDDEYRPVNVYGKSKYLMEEMIRRDGEIPGIWSIVRPTNIWGPWHPRYAQEFWLIVKKGRYVHPGGGPVRRAYGYVGNVVEYVCSILKAERSVVEGKTFYLGDPVEDIKVWAGAFSEALVGHKPRTVPRPVLRAIAFVGDAMILAGGRFPLFTSRYRSMTREYLVEMKPTFAALGLPRYQLAEGVRITADWLKTQGPPWTS